MSTTDDSGVTVLYIGGPRGGTQQGFSRDPRRVTCGTEAKAKGMFGLYVTHQVLGRKVTMYWKALATPNHVMQ
jgi:hypothetical protein